MAKAKNKMVTAKETYIKVEKAEVSSELNDLVKAVDSSGDITSLEKSLNLSPAQTELLKLWIDKRIAMKSAGHIYDVNLYILKSIINQ